jgi:L,D-peptidoglycan transpeptidase YkuD (ErfK/YbiS/YcfS/YnhG family)
MMSPSNYNGTLSTHFGTINMQNNLAPSNYNATILQSDNGNTRNSGAGSTIYGGGFTIQPAA